MESYVADILLLKKNQILKNHLEKINAAEEIARHFTTKKQLE